MKTFPIHISIIFLLLHISFVLNAQDKGLSQDNFLFSTGEKQITESRQSMHKAIATNNYDLKYHRFYWVIDPAQRYISGSVTSYFVATQAGMNSIQFELNAGLSADSAIFEGKNTSIDHTGDMITIPLYREVPSGMLDSVTVYYHGIPGVSGFGSFANYVHNGVPSMWTLSEPYGASDWWPSKNDLTDKIDSIDVYVIMPKGNHTASNGILVNETPYGTNSTLAHWKHRYPIASYLIAIAVTNYARYSDYYKSGSDSIEILNYVYPEDSVDIRPTTPDVVKTMALYEQLFSPYPFRKEKYGHAETNMSGGMEHQTMTFLGKSSFNHYILSHELAHQWFGDMITCGSWQDIWLNEGFATYCYTLSLEYMYDEATFKNFVKYMQDFVISKEQGSVFCTDTTNVSRIFNSSLTYYKGALLLHMLRWILGDTDFFQGIRNYLNDPFLVNGFAHTTDLKRHLELQSGKDLTEFFADWYYGTGMPGYTIEVKQHLDLNASVTINQTQLNSNVGFFHMILPIKFKGGGKDTTAVFNNTFSGQIFEFTPGFKIDSVFFDPDHKILHYQSEFTMNQVVKDEKTIIRPNPANEFLEIQHKAGVINYLQILNLEGQTEITIPTKQEDSFLELNIRHLPSGVYILKIGTSDWIETKKFIVNR